MLLSRTLLSPQPLRLPPLSRLPEPRARGCEPRVDFRSRAGRPVPVRRARSVPASTRRPRSRVLRLIAPRLVRAAAAAPRWRPSHPPPPGWPLAVAVFAGASGVPRRGTARLADYPFAEAPDGQPGLGTQPTLRAVERRVAPRRGPTSTCRSAGGATCAPSIRTSRATAARTRRSAWWTWRAARRVARALAQDRHPEVLARATTDPFSESPSADEALVLVRVRGDARRSAREVVLAEARFEVARARSTFALLDAHTHGLGRPEEPGTPAVLCSQLDLALARLRAALADLDALAPPAGARCARQCRGARIAQAFVLGDREAGRTWTLWVADAAAARSRCFRAAPGGVRSLRRGGAGGSRARDRGGRGRHRRATARRGRAPRGSAPWREPAAGRA